tara:strand:+ start:6593 stop:6772 length:180 start_codon:yes stop_codon:yes gene_type:complete
MAEKIGTTVEIPKPDEKLLKKVVAENTAILKKTTYRKEAPTYANHTAVSSDERVRELAK